MQIPHKSHTNLFKIDHGPREQTKSVILKTEEDFTVRNFFSANISCWPSNVLLRAPIKISYKSPCKSHINLTSIPYKSHINIQQIKCIKSFKNILQISFQHSDNSLPLGILLLLPISNITNVI